MTFGWVRIGLEENNGSIRVSFCLFSPLLLGGFKCRKVHVRPVVERLQDTISILSDTPYIMRTLQ